MSHKLAIIVEDMNIKTDLARGILDILLKGLKTGAITTAIHKSLDIVNFATNVQWIDLLCSISIMENVLDRYISGDLSDQDAIEVELQCALANHTTLLSDKRSIRNDDETRTDIGLGMLDLLLDGLQSKDHLEAVSCETVMLFAEKELGIKMMDFASGVLFPWLRGELDDYTKIANALEYSLSLKPKILFQGERYNKCGTKIPDRC